MSARQITGERPNFFSCQYTCIWTISRANINYRVTEHKTLLAFYQRCSVESLKQKKHEINSNIPSGRPAGAAAGEGAQGLGVAPPVEVATGWPAGVAKSSAEILSGQCVTREQECLAIRGRLKRGRSTSLPLSPRIMRATCLFEPNCADQWSAHSSPQVLENQYMHACVHTCTHEHTRIHASTSVRTTHLDYFVIEVHLMSHVRARTHKRTHTYTHSGDRRDFYQQKDWKGPQGGLLSESPRWSLLLLSLHS